VEETQAVIATAPPFRHPSPDGPLLDELVASVSLLKWLDD